MRNFFFFTLLSSHFCFYFVIGKIISCNLLFLIFTYSLPPPWRFGTNLLKTSLFSCRLMCATVPIPVDCFYLLCSLIVKRANERNVLIDLENIYKTKQKQKSGSHTIVHRIMAWKGKNVQTNKKKKKVCNFRIFENIFW